MDLPAGGRIRPGHGHGPSPSTTKNFRVNSEARITDMERMPVEDSNLPAHNLN